MNKNVKTMIELQEVMMKMKALEDEKNSIPEKISGLKNDMLDAEELFNEVSEEFEKLRKKKIDLESEIEGEKHKIEKSKGRLMSIKTNREYFAMLKEIDMAKRLNRQREDELLELMIRYDEVEKRHTELDGRYGALKNEYDTKMVDIVEQMKGFDKGILELKSEKEEIAVKLDRNMSKRFELVFRRRNGLAVVPARDYICLGCNMNIPPQLYNLLQREDRIYECPNCSRIIYFENSKEKEAS